MVIDYDVTGHYLVLPIVHCDAPSKGNQPHKFSGSLVNFNEKHFINDLQLKIKIFTPKIFEISENNLNEVFKEFYSLITSSIDAHAPVEKLSRKQKKNCKKMYHHQKLGEYHNNPKKTWNTLRTLLPSKSASKVPNCVSVNNASKVIP